MYLRKQPLLILLLCIGSYNSIFSQCHLPAPPLSRRIQEAAAVIEGQVVSQKSFWDATHRIIYTSSTVSVSHSYKSNDLPETIEIITPGGVVDGKMLKVSGALELQIGDYGIFLGRHNIVGSIANRSGAPAYFAGEGIYAYLPVNLHAASLSDDGKSISLEAFSRLARQVTGQTKKTIQRQKAALKDPTTLSVLSSFSPATVSAGTGSTITISGSGFGASPGTVFFRNSNTGGANFIGTAPSQIISWDDNTIIAQVPSGAGSGTFFIRDAANVTSPLSASPLTVTYNITNVTLGDGVFHRTYLIDDGANGDGGYRFAFSNNTANNGVNFTTHTAAMLRIAEAAARWTSSVSYPIYAQGCAAPTTLQTPGQDDVNIISFDSDAWDLDLQSGSSTLAVAYSYYSRCGTSNWELTDMDIIFRRDGNPNGIGGAVNWNFSDAAPGAGQIDFFSVAVHEIGHTLQIGHIINAGAVMHYAIAPGTMSRTLSAGSDIAAGTNVMNASLSYSPPVIPCVGDYGMARQAANYMPAADCGILAIQLSSFGAKAVSDDAVLNWTASSQNGDAFSLQRSSDGIHFSDLKYIAAATGLHDYEWTDTDLAPGNYYYRLALLHENGKINYSAIEKLVIHNSKSSWIITQSSSQVQIMLSPTPRREETEITLLQINGQILRRLRLASGSSTSIDISQLANGTYILRANINGQPATQKIVVAR